MPSSLLMEFNYISHTPLLQVKTATTVVWDNSSGGEIV